MLKKWKKIDHESGSESVLQANRMVLIRSVIDAKAVVLGLITGRICRRQLCRYFVYSRADFGVFRPAGATRCTDQGQI